MPYPPRPSWRARSRLLAIAATAALVAAGLTTAAPPAAAEPPPGAPAAIAATHHVTLVTGDVVSVTTLASGEEVVDVDRPDGATGGVRVRQHGDDLFVLPDEALPLVHAAQLDRRLFNITDLIEMGYDDAHADSIPLIARYPAATARAANPPAPRGSGTTRRLASIGGAALAAEKDQVRTFWTTVTAAATGSLAGGVTHLWLDGRVRATLDESVPQVGAPQAWQAGYDGTGTTVAVLDSGVDASHPDLAGRVIDTASFVPGVDATDVNGHGTLVASTVAGTGAASDGTYRGVAPGAELIVGKVLGDDGFGLDSWVLAGMEWAAAAGADVVNMSLGDDALPSDGTDPKSLAVEALTAQHGTLFVVAAGNSGPGVPIGSPSAAASALTVGAVDTQDSLAWFSSTGPLAGSGAIKPDLVAPGVGITAARSGQMPGEPEPYRTLDGTSMATPHVAGAAAILLQQHPDWSAARLKDALMSSAAGLDAYTPYEVGTGRLDVAAATTNPAHATGSVFHGFFDWPHGPADIPVDRTVTFTNPGAGDVTLDLAVAGDGPFSVDDTTITVPAGGSAEAAVTGDPTAVGPGVLSGYLVGTDPATGAALTRTALGLVKEDERYDLTITLTGRDGEPEREYVVVQRLGDPWPEQFLVAGERTLRLPPGTYSVLAYLDVAGERPDARGLALLVDPERVGAGAGAGAEVVLDAREARKVEAVTPRRSEDRQRRFDLRRAGPDGTGLRDAYLIPAAYDDLYALPTGEVTEGTFELVTRWRTGEPLLTVRAPGLAGVDAVVQPGSTLTEGSGVRRAVYAGEGAEADYAGIDAAGKVVVVRRSDRVPPPERAAAAAAAGAALLLVVHDGPGRLNEWVGESPIPVASVHRDDGARLVARAKTGQLSLTVAQVPYAGYLYDLTRRYSGAVPDRDLTYRPGPGQLARIDAGYTAAGPVIGNGFRYDITDGFIPALGLREVESYPGTRTEWVTPDQVWHETHFQDMWEERSYRDAYRARSRTAVEWFAPVVRPAFSRGYFGPSRYRDFLTVNIQAWSGSSGLETGGSKDWGAVPTSLELYQGDELVARNQFGSDLQWIEVPPEPLPYRLVLDASRPADPWLLSTRTHTEWEFRSGTNDADDFVTFPLLQLDYRVQTDRHGTAAAGRTQQIELTAHMQAGATGGGRVSSATLAVSYDDGESWQPVTLRATGDGTWQGTLRHDGPPGGFVSLRAAAATDAGWRIDQEIVRAYGLR
jgi:subtilisin family serine protease